MLTGQIAYDESGGAIERESRPGEKIELKLPGRILESRRAELPKSVWRLVDAYVFKTLSLKLDDRFATKSEWLSAAQELRDQARYVATEKPPNIPLVRFLRFCNKLLGR